MHIAFEHRVARQSVIGRQSFHEKAEIDRLKTPFDQQISPTQFVQRHRNLTTDGGVCAEARHAG